MWAFSFELINYQDSFETLGETWEFLFGNMGYVGFPGGPSGKNTCLPKQETWVQSLGWVDPLEEGTATRSSILAWRVSWTEEPGRLQSMGSQRVGHDWGTNTFTLAFPGGPDGKEPANAGDIRDAGSVPGLGRSPGKGNGYPLQYSCLENSMGIEPGRLYSPWSHKESDMTERLTLSLYLFT